MARVNLTEKEKRTVLIVLDELLRKDYSDLNKMYGSETIKDMQLLRGKLGYEDYCDRHNITYEEMTYADYEDAYHERYDT